VVEIVDELLEKTKIKVESIEDVMKYENHDVGTIQYIERDPMKNEIYLVTKKYKVDLE